MKELVERIVPCILIHPLTQLVALQPVVHIQEEFEPLQKQTEESHERTEHGDHGRASVLRQHGGVLAGALGYLTLVHLAHVQQRLRRDLFYTRRLNPDHVELEQQVPYLIQRATR